MDTEFLLDKLASLEAKTEANRLVLIELVAGLAEKQIMTKEYLNERLEAITKEV